MRGGDYYGVQNTNGIRFGNAVCNIGAFCGFVYQIAVAARYFSRSLLRRFQTVVRFTLR